MQGLVESLSTIPPEMLLLAALTLALTRLTKRFFPKFYTSAAVYMPFVAGCAVSAIYLLATAGGDDWLTHGTQTGSLALILDTALNQLAGKGHTVILPSENKLMTVTGILTGITDFEHAKSLAQKILKQLETTSDTQQAVSLCQKVLSGAGLNKTEKELLNISCIILGALSLIKL